MFLQHTSCSSLLTEICRVLKITALCQKSSRKICRWFWATIQPHQTQRTLPRLHKQWQLQNPPSPTIQLFLPQAHLVEPFFHGGHFNITLNTLNKSPNTSKCSVSTVARSYKRIKRVLDRPAVPFQWQFFVKVFLIDSTIRCFWGHLMMY